MAEKPGLGVAVDRVDGPAKVTGQAHYAAEHWAEGMLVGVAVPAAIARGRVTRIDDGRAREVPGVVEVITHLNRPHIPWFDRKGGGPADITEPPFPVLCDDVIHFSGQPIALVVGESFEAAREGAMQIEAAYQTAQHNTALLEALSEKFAPSRKKPPTKVRGDPHAAMMAAPVTVRADYQLAMEYHNPMELHGTTVIRHEDGSLDVHDKNQGSQNVRQQLVSAFGLAEQNLRVFNTYVGGAFGSGLQAAYQAYLAVLAAIMLERSMRVVLTRQQMFTHVHRPACVQHIELGADRQGKLSAIVTHATTSTSRMENYTENIVTWGATAYACENTDLDYTLAPIDTPTPGNMRAPGAATGMNLFEIAMDELAYAAGMDPLALRLANYSDHDGLRGQPYTSKALRAAYEEAAARFGWEARRPQPRSMKEGRELVGWGVATGIWEALMMEASAEVSLDADGTLTVASAASDIGTGTYTIMAQIAAGATGLPLDRIVVRAGESALPKSPLEGGSAMAASTGAAVDAACRALIGKLMDLARKQEGGPLHGARDEDLEAADGGLRRKNDPGHLLGFDEIVAASGEHEVRAQATVKPQPREERTLARNTHSAVFAEVRVDEDLGVVRVTRVVVAVAAGRIVNPKTARSQILGGVVMGIGMALQEEAMFDHRIGRIMNHNLAEYHVPVNADVFDIDVIFVPETDQEVSPLGIKGVGEIGIVGTAAAIANAVFHATGKRLRSLPITLDKLL